MTETFETKRSGWFRPATVKKTEDARQGETSGRMRWVLGLSLVLIVAVFGAEFGFTALFGAHQ